MTPAELRARTEAFSVRALQFTNPLLDRLATRDSALQLRRSATSVAQNYGACTIARSHRDFVAKLRLTLEEADESARWLRILRDAGLAAGPDADALLREATELARILGASCITATSNAEKYARRSGRLPAATPHTNTPGERTSPSAPGAPSAPSAPSALSALSAPANSKSSNSE